MVPMVTSTSHQVHIMETNLLFDQFYPPVLISRLHQLSIIFVTIYVTIKRFLLIQAPSNNFHFQRSYQQTVTCQVYILILLNVSNILLIRRVVTASPKLLVTGVVTSSIVDFVANELIRDSAVCHCLSIYSLMIRVFPSQEFSNTIKSL